MILEKLRSVQPQNIAILAMVCILIKIPQFFNPISIKQFPFTGILSQLIINLEWLQTIPIFINQSLATLCIFLQAMMINQLTLKYKFFARGNFMVAVSYILLANIIPAMFVITPTLLVNFLFILIYDRLINLYKTPFPIQKSYDVGLLTGIALLIAANAIAFIFIGFMALSILRPFYWKFYLSILLGCLTILFFVFAIHLFIEQGAAFLSLAKHLFEFGSTLNEATFNKINNFVIVPFSIILLLSAVSFIRDFFKKPIIVRRYFQVLAISMFFILSTIILKHTTIDSLIGLSVIPFSFFLGTYFYKNKISWFNESIYTFLLCMILLAQLL